jgi:hypothetical protein
VFNSILWHATERDRTMTRLRTLTNRVLGIAGEMSSSASVTQNDLTRLEDATTAVAEFVRQNVQPYYPVRNPVTDGNNTFVQQVKLAARRGDPQGLDQALTRLRNFYSNYTSQSYFNTRFPNDVIHQRLYPRMTRAQETDVLFGLFHPGADYVAVSHVDDKPDDINADGVPQHAHEWDSGHVTVTHVHPHDDLHGLDDHQNEPVDRLTYAYNRDSGGFDILRDDAPDDQRMDEYVVERSSIFEPVRVPEQHVDEGYLQVGYPSRDFASPLPVHFQKFQNALDAQRALENLLAADVFQQGTGQIIQDDNDARDWRRVFYTQRGASYYGYMLELGDFLVTIGPSGTEWGNRTDWPEAVARSWLGDETPQRT